MVFFHTIGKAQVLQDSIKKKIKKNEIELVYNHYLQDGNNSAVTGGTGTEELSVYGPSINYKRTANNSSFGLSVGTDIITSASVDNIDLVTSSSLVDARTYFNANFQQTVKDWNVSLGIGSSIESDYFSRSINFGLQRDDNKNLVSYWMMFQYYNDDLRWGRLNEETGNKPTILIYPVELRNQDWYDDYKRNSYNLKFGTSFPLSKKSLLGLASELGYQEGLLATPFHRVYFNDGTLSVEQLPYNRIKWSGNAKYNVFLSKRIILRNQLSLYTDSWGIKSIAAENETIIIINRTTRITPNARLYSQSNSKYFEKHESHNPRDEFYTSDYDLSKFYSLALGLGLKYSPLNLNEREVMFKRINLSYNVYIRTDGLTAHMLTSSFVIDYVKSNSKKNVNY